MGRMKKLMAIMLLAVVASLGAPHALAGVAESPGITGVAESPGIISTTIIVIASTSVL